MQALGATLITLVAIVLCARILRGRKRWRGLSSNGLSRRMGSLSSFPGFTSGLGKCFLWRFVSISYVQVLARISTLRLFEGCKTLLSLERREIVVPRS